MRPVNPTLRFTWAFKCAHCKKLLQYSPSTFVSLNCHPPHSPSPLFLTFLLGQLYTKNMCNSFATMFCLTFWFLPEWLSRLPEVEVLPNTFNFMASMKKWEFVLNTRSYYWRHLRLVMLYTQGLWLRALNCVLPGNLGSTPAVFLPGSPRGWG